MSVEVGRIHCFTEDLVGWNIPSVSYFIHNARSKICSPKVYLLGEQSLPGLTSNSNAVDISPGYIKLIVKCKNDRNPLEFIRVGVTDENGKEINRCTVDRKIPTKENEDFWCFRTSNLVQVDELKSEQSKNLLPYFRIFCEIGQLDENYPETASPERKMEKDQLFTKSPVKLAVTEIGEIRHVLDNHIEWSIPDACYILENVGKTIWSPKFQYLEAARAFETTHSPPDLEIPEGWIGLTINRLNHTQNPLSCIQVGVTDDEENVVNRSNVILEKASLSSSLTFCTSELVQKVEIKECKEKGRKHYRIFCEIKHDKDCPFYEKELLKQASVQRKIGTFLAVASGSSGDKKHRKSRRK